MSRFAVAKEKILDDLEAIVADLFRTPRKAFRNSLVNIVNPFRPGAKADQACVWLKAPRRGAWRDFVSGEAGDAIDLVAFGLEGDVNGESRKRAVAWAFDRYGLGTMTKGERERTAAEARSRKLAAEANAERDLEKRRRRAQTMFYAGAEELGGSPVAAYLESRGVPLGSVPHMTRSFRWRPDGEYWLDEARPRFPALLSAMVDGSGKLGAVHMTLIARDGSRKAAVDKPKLMWPETAGHVIRITNGPSGLTPEQAAAHAIAGPCGLMEGIEDGMTLGRADPDLRLWAAGSLSGLLSVPDHPCVSSWIIFKDNDWGKRQAQEQFDRAVKRLRGFKKPVEIVSMPAEWGKDPNDAINRN